jgi:hypothetical protein
MGVLLVRARLVSQLQVEKPEVSGRSAVRGRAADLDVKQREDDP